MEEGLGTIPITKKNLFGNRRVRKKSDAEQNQLGMSERKGGKRHCRRPKGTCAVNRNTQEVRYKGGA